MLTELNGHHVETIGRACYVYDDTVATGPVAQYGPHAWHVAPRQGLRAHTGTVTDERSEWEQWVALVDELRGVPVPLAHWPQGYPRDDELALHGTLLELGVRDPAGELWCAVLCLRTLGAYSTPETHRVVRLGPHRLEALSLGMLRLAAYRAQGLSVDEARLERLAGLHLQVAGVCDEMLTSGRYAEGRRDHWVWARKFYHAVDALFAAPNEAVLEVLEAFDDLAERTVRLRELVALVDHQLQPVAVERPGEARPEHQPLWDWVVERHPEPLRVGSLGDALARARRWRLRWRIPQERAIAERLDRLPGAQVGPR